MSSVVAAAAGSPARPRGRRRLTKGYRAAIGVYLALCVLVAALALFPVRNPEIRLLLVAGCFTLWAGALFLFWDRLFVRVLCLLLVLPPALLLLFPMRPIDTDALRASYVAALKTYDGAPYRASGETHLGIDETGLPRAALLDAELAEGVRQRNPMLIRKCAGLWWNDRPAERMVQQADGRTRHLFDAADFWKIDTSRLQSGDMAVAADARCVLVFTGSDWLYASPEGGRVSPVGRPESDRFRQTFRLIRWQILEPPAAPTAEPR